MKILQSTVVSFVVLAMIIAAGCNKEKFPSRDTSGLKPTPVVPPPPPDPTLVVFDPADQLTDWEVVGGGVEEKAGQKEGAAYLKSVIHTGDDYMHFIKHRPTAVDPKLTVENGQFVFWFYVSSVADLKVDGQIELTSSGQSDKNEYSWNLSNYIPSLKNGWNEMKLNFSNAPVSGDGGPDIHAFNFFRIYFWTNDKTSHGDVTVGVDDLKTRARPKISESFNNCDALDNWVTAGNVGVIEKAGKKEGLGYLKATIVRNEDYMHFIYNRPTALNAGLTEATGQLRFWFYVGNVADLKPDGQIELTSSGKSDDHEYSWNLDQLIPNLKNGWNEVTLDLSAANKSGDGGPDINAFNFFRIYLWTASKDHNDETLGIDDIRLMEK